MNPRDASASKNIHSMKITIYLSMIKNNHFANTGCFGYLHPQKGPAAYL